MPLLIGRLSARISELGVCDNRRICIRQRDAAQRGLIIIRSTRTASCHESEPVSGDQSGQLHPIPLPARVKTNAVYSNGTDEVGLSACWAEYRLEPLKHTH